jgi:TolA-binding protein
MDQMLPRPATPGEALLMQQNTMLFQENCVRSRNEQALYAAWKNAVVENNNLSTLITTLQAQMQELRREIATLAGENEQVGQQEPASTEYYTDEEELAKEMEWIAQHKRNAKKRKMDISCNTPKQSSSEQHQQQPKHEAAKSPKLPPIIIYQVRVYDIIYYIYYLNTKLEQNYIITLLNSGDLKLIVDTEDHYRTASKMLNEAQFILSTYENKQTRPIRVIVKKLHNSFTPEQTVQELRRKVYQIIDAVNSLKWKTKEPLPVFMLTFDRTENIPKMYEITNIGGMRVEITPYRKTKLLPQCKNCQSLGAHQILLS